MTGNSRLNTECISYAKKQFPDSIIIVLLPFLLFYWMAPFLSNMTIGSDYLRYSFSQQLELLFSLKSNSFPTPTFQTNKFSHILSDPINFSQFAHLWRAPYFALIIGFPVLQL